jgi:hypothetical protein
MAILETVKVKTDNEDGYKVINKKDMTNSDKLYVEPRPKRKQAAKK